jgi:hypothetical protein
MSDLEVLFLVLALIYGWECLGWVRRGAVVFRTRFGRRWKPVHPGALLGNQEGGIIFTHPLPPLGVVLSGNQFPLSLSPDGVLAHVASSINPGWRPPQSGRFIRFEEIKAVEARAKQVRVNGELLLKTSSPQLAQFIASQLRRLAKLSPREREKTLVELCRSGFDTKAIENRWREFRQHAASLRNMCNALFAYLFLLAPLLIRFVGLKRCWLVLVIGLFVLSITTAILFRRAHKKLYPQADDERFTHFLTILLSPPTATRAHDVLSRPLLEEFHPLAIAHVFCPAAEFRRLARLALIEVRHPALPLCPNNDPTAVATERHARARLQQTIEEFVRKNGVDLEELVRPSAPTDETCQSYCPRCGNQFTTPTGQCADCGGLPLQPLSSRS